jgi:hypothetical protein
MQKDWFGGTFLFMNYHEAHKAHEDVFIVLVIFVYFVVVLNSSMLAVFNNKKIPLINDQRDFNMQFGKILFSYNFKFEYRLNTFV